jgi:soluble lytic murein transglycosylase
LVLKAFTARLFAVAVAGLAAVGARASDDDTFLSAREAFQKGNIERLDRLAATLSDHPLYPYVVYWQLRARLDEQPDSAVQAFLTEHKDALIAQRLRADLLKQLGERRRWEEFERDYASVQLDDVELACYRLQAGLARSDAGVPAQARVLWLQGAAQPDSCGPVFDALVRSGDLTEDDVWARIRLALEAGSVTFAKSLGAYLAPGQRIDGKQLDAIARNPQRFLDRKPLHVKTRAQRELALFATWRVAQNLPAVAATRLERFDHELPPADRAYAWGQVALAGALRHRPEAAEWFRKAGSGALTDRQLAWRTRTALRAADWATVVASIDAMSGRERQLTPWRYWKGRALVAQGRTVEGNTLLAGLSTEHHFYGQLASEDLGNALSSVPTIYHPAADEVAAVEQAPGIRRALKFYDLGLRYEGALEWRWTVRGYDDRSLLAAAEVARRAGWYERAIDTADQTRTLHDFTLRYPTPYREVVSGYTRQLALDEAWVYGLVRQESRFVVDARSSAGAAGLMQIMPATARQVARRLGLAGFNKQRVTVVETNINLGTYYLRDLMEALDHQPVMATAGYNAGPSRARAWRADKPLEGAVYTESIPFNETRDYVRKVMSNTMYYSRLIGQQFTGLRERLGVIPPRPLDNE